MSHKLYKGLEIQYLSQNICRINNYGCAKPMMPHSTYKPEAASNMYNYLEI